MKHSAMDAKISHARRASMETADRLRNTEKQVEHSNIVLQQNCLVTSESDSAKSVQTGSTNSNVRLPGTSVRHMQKRSKSMTSNNNTESSNVQNQVPEIIRNGEPEIKTPALRRSYSTMAVSNNKDNTR